VYVVGDRRRGENSQMVQTYVEVLCREIGLVDLQGNRGNPYPLDSSPRVGEGGQEQKFGFLTVSDAIQSVSGLQTVFFGGGTPSLLSPAQLVQILAAIEQHIGISPNAEISMEIDPGTFDLEQLAAYAAAGVNRVSMGVQAWQDELLQLCGRSHNVADIERSIEIIQQSSVSNWSLDLISGLPQQTMEMWRESLARSIEVNPSHISVYDLIVEAQTPFAKQYKPDCLPLPSDETTAQMYREAQMALTAAGYRHYEISNYARAADADSSLMTCRHNQVYWCNDAYYAFGMGAASYIEGTRFTRPRYTQDYFDWVAAGAVYPQEVLGNVERFLETLMLGLRTAKGLQISRLIDEFGLDLWLDARGRLEQYCPHWVVMDSEHLQLTDPEGFLYSNTVLADLFEIDEY
jgi:putative oxygen-independent coproporphyrinogen III oxidase